MGTTRRTAAALAALVACSAALTGTAEAKRYPVSGIQTAVQGPGDEFRMAGDLVGTWRITAFHPLGTEPFLAARGRELFRGCIDLGHDGGCAGDPSGKLRLKFRYWALFAPGGALRAGACWHPIIGGTRAFRHARGVIQMLDVPKEDGSVETHYTGNVTTGRRAAGATASASDCGG
jgi:hypothetical protein